MAAPPSWFTHTRARFTNKTKLVGLRGCLFTLLLNTYSGLACRLPNAESVLPSTLAAARSLHADGLPVEMHSFAAKCELGFPQLAILSPIMGCTPVSKYARMCEKVS